MKAISQTHKDQMGRFHNKLTELIDTSDTGIVETIVVLRMMLDTLEQLFKTYAMIEKPKVEKKE